MAANLQKKILREVSRSFYLSLRLLPKPMREAAGCGYLLARLSDTIADASAAPPESREELLAHFGLVLDQSTEGEKWAAQVSQLSSDPALSIGEKKLLARAADCLSALDQLPSWQGSLVRGVVRTIICGQTWDLTRFSKPNQEVVILQTSDELETYAYQVAGCVGEFWTRLAAGTRPDFSAEPLEKMLKWGASYGRGLQLINILRDLPADLKIGRCYLPVSNLEPHTLLAARQKWIAEARQSLAHGQQYCDALHGKRLRISSRLPALIGESTLDLLEKTDWPQWQARVKIPRKLVRRHLLQAIRRC